MNDKDYNIFMFVKPSLPFFQTHKFSSATPFPNFTLRLTVHPEQGLQAIFSNPRGISQPATVEVSGVDLHKLKQGKLPLSIFHDFSIRVIRYSDGTLLVRLMPTLLDRRGKGIVCLK